MLLITVINLVLIFMMIYIYICHAMFVWYISIWHCMKCAVVREQTATCHRSVPWLPVLLCLLLFGKEYLSRTDLAYVSEVPWHYSIGLTVATPPSSMDLLRKRFPSDTIPYGTTISFDLGTLFWVIGRLTSANRQFLIASWSKTVHSISIASLHSKSNPLWSTEHSRNHQMFLIN